MSPPRGIALEQRVLVVAPTGRDAVLTRDVLGRAGFAVEICANLDWGCDALEGGAGALLIAEEALSASGLARLSGALARQPPWSDLPVIISIAQGEPTAGRLRALDALERTGNVTLLERPLRIITLVAAVQASLRARARQYQMRDLHQQLREQMDRLQLEREMRARFVTLLAHDLRGPVSTAMLAAGLLAVPPDARDRAQELGARITRNLQRVDRMVRDLLDASRIHAGQPLPLELAPGELSGIAVEVAGDLNQLHGPRVVVRGSEEVHGVWSSGELRRALWNLTANALKYGAPEHPVTLSLSRDEGLARVSVHNRGNPLSTEDRARIFEPFARTRGAEQGRQHGWGLGLTLVRGCVEAHGGRVLVESSAEAGTTFTLELPLDARRFQPDTTPARPDSSETAAS